MNKTETNRFRLFFFTSVQDWEEGDVTRSVLVTGDLEMGREMLSFINSSSSPEGVYLFEVEKNPGY